MAAVVLDPSRLFRYHGPHCPGFSPAWVRLPATLIKSPVRRFAGAGCCGLSLVVHDRQDNIASVSMLEIRIFDLAGFFGVILFLGAYAALQLGFVRGQGYTYASLNMLAAALVLISMIGAFHLSSAIIQGSWIVLSLVGIARFYILSHMARFSDEEKHLLENAFPNLDKVTSRKLLNLGSWRSAEPNEVLTEIGIPIPYLCFLTEGSASVFVNDRKVADVKSDTYIGDITALSGDPATATVVISEP